MEMTIYDYIKEHYPMEERVKTFLNTPYDIVMNQDNFKFDDIRMCDGKLEKVMEVDDDWWIPIQVLIGFGKSKDPEVDAKCIEEARALLAPEEFAVYMVYREFIDVEDFNVQKIMDVSKDYLEKKRGEREKVTGCIR